MVDVIERGRNRCKESFSWDGFRGIVLGVLHLPVVHGENTISFAVGTIGATGYYGLLMFSTYSFGLETISHYDDTGPSINQGKWRTGMKYLFAALTIDLIILWAKGFVKTLDARNDQK